MHGETSNQHRTRRPPYWNRIKDGHAALISRALSAWLTTGLDRVPLFSSFSPETQYNWRLWGFSRSFCGVWLRISLHPFKVTVKASYLEIISFERLGLNRKRKSHKSQGWRRMNEWMNEWTLCPSKGRYSLTWEVRLPKFISINNV